LTSDLSTIWKKKKKIITREAKGNLIHQDIKMKEEIEEIIRMIDIEDRILAERLKNSFPIEMNMIKILKTKLTSLTSLKSETNIMNLYKMNVYKERTVTRMKKSSKLNKIWVHVLKREEMTTDVRIMSIQTTNKQSIWKKIMGNWKMKKNTTI
jgi:hypothetical protein